LPTGLKNAVRTTSCNDFILKYGKINKAKITLDEFRMGVLLGYLYRHVRPDGILTDDSLSGKNHRWADDGKTDIECQKLLKFANLK
jgi:hypothetical protein